MIAVAKLVYDIGGSMEMRAAALLHDVLEDTHIGHEELMVFLHSVPDVTPAQACEIHGMVVELTDIYTHESFPNKNRKARKLLEAARGGVESRMGRVDAVASAGIVRASRPRRGSDVDRPRVTSASPERGARPDTLVAATFGRGVFVMHDAKKALLEACEP